MLRGSARLKLVIVATVLAAVLAVLIAPSIDMPETVLREHHVASHSTVTNASGTLAAVRTISDSLAFRYEAVQLSESLAAFDHGHSQTSLVMRC